MDPIPLTALIGLVAFAYAMVGHGGASGYLALMALAGTAAEHDLFVQQVRLHDALRRIAREAA